MSPKWVSKKIPPDNAVHGGYDCDGTPIYVGRSTHKGDQMPAKVVPSKRCAFVPYQGKEHKKTSYQILVGEGYYWTRANDGKVPENAVSSGKTNQGELLYVGRGQYSNSLMVGKVHPSHGCIYLPFNGKEIALTTYEVLVHLESGWSCSIL